MLNHVGEHRKPSHGARAPSVLFHGITATDQPLVKHAVFWHGFFTPSLFMPRWSTARPGRWPPHVRTHGCEYVVIKFFVGRIMPRYTQFQTPLCEVILVGNDTGITHLHLCTGEGKRAFTIQPEWRRDDAFFEDATAQVQAFMAGRQKAFHLKLNPAGTDFQKRVWAELTRIPFGELRSYTEIARGIGNEKAARAVGMANSKNPIPLIIPCHRVVGSTGALTGFAHGLAMKSKLIELEQTPNEDHA